VGSKTVTTTIVTVLLYRSFDLYLCLFRTDVDIGTQADRERQKTTTVIVTDFYTSPTLPLTMTCRIDK
jgi:hypothetical protein